MRYKAQVLKQEPSARVLTVERHEDGKPRLCRVFVGSPLDGSMRPLDAHGISGLWQRGAGAAWRSAYYALVRARMAAQRGDAQ